MQPLDVTSLVWNLGCSCPKARTPLTSSQRPSTLLLPLLTLWEPKRKTGQNKLQGEAINALSPQSKARSGYFREVSAAVIARATGIINAVSPTWEIYGDPCPGWSLETGIRRKRDWASHRRRRKPTSDNSKRPRPEKKKHWSQYVSKYKNGSLLSPSYL